MNTYSLPCDWQITVPDNWLGEYNNENGQYVFYPVISDLTIRITPLRAERNGVLASADVMKNAYINTIPTTAISRNANSYNLDGFAVSMYESTLIEENHTVYVIYIGYYAAGELLSINDFGTDKAECEQALNILQTIKKVMYKMY